MYHFEYVTKAEAAPVKKELIAIINAVQDLLRDHFTFRFDFIGSSARNMITQDVKSNIGFDFDVNIEVNYDGEEYTAKELREMLKAAFDRIVPSYGYSPAEQSTRVLTIKFKNTAHSKIVHSCDIAIIYYCDDADFYGYYYLKNWKDERKDCKKEVQYTFEPRALRGNVDEKLETILTYQNGWNAIRDEYLKLKNVNTDGGKRSFSLYLEAVNNIYNQLPDDDSGYDYYDDDEDDDYWD